MDLGKYCVVWEIIGLPVKCLVGLRGKQQRINSDALKRQGIEFELV